MNTNKFPDNYFTWFLPEEKPPYVITIPNEHTLSLNEKLRKQITGPIKIGISADGKTICVRPIADSGFRVLNSGRIHAETVIAALLRSGIKLPARYSVQEDEDRWIGVWEAPSAKAVKLQPQMKAPSPRKRKALEEELRSL